MEVFFYSLTAVVMGESTDEVYAKVKEVIRDQSGPTIWVPSKDKLWGTGVCRVAWSIWLYKSYKRNTRRNKESLEYSSK